MSGRKNDERKLKYVLIKKEELKEKGELLPGAKNLLEDLRAHGVCVLEPEEGWEKPPEESLCLRYRCSA